MGARTQKADRAPVTQAVEKGPILFCSDADNVEQEQSASLSAPEDQELQDCETVIRRGWDTFVEVGLALARIRDRRLYRKEFSTFEAYCREKWQYGHSQAYYLISAAAVVTELSTIVDIPKPIHESQVRPLIGLTPDQACAAWKKAVENAEGRVIAARIVKEAAALFKKQNRRKSAEPKSIKQTGYVVQKLLMELEKLILKKDDTALRAKFAEVEEAFREYQIARKS